MSAPRVEQPATNEHTPGPAPSGPLHHVFDGIEEHDNHLPNWWLAILFGSIIFGFGYWFVYETTKSLPGPLSAYRAEMAAILKKRADSGPLSDETLGILAKDASVIADGQKTFTSMCSPCHGPQGAGQVGPNLTDKFWMHGANPMAIHKSITEGFPDKGMPAWGPMLGPARVRSLAAFVVSMKGKNLPGKEPQGEPVAD